MKKLTFLFVILFLTSILAAQKATSSINDKLLGFAKKAVLFSYNYAQEKTYLQFDNTGYYLGDNIWFKAYVVNALNNQPSDMSKTLYVDLLTQEGDLVENKKLRLNNGISSGHFHLPDSLPGGFYEVRAYTRSMLNFGNDVVFSRVFPIYSAPIPEGNFTDRIMAERKFEVPDYRDKNPNNSALNLTFYPEGGNLVNGLTSTIAFKATDKQGTNVDLIGIVYNKDNRQVAEFKTAHDGMGVFALNPDDGDYTVKVMYNGKEERVKLPEVILSGYVMTASLTNDSIRLTINRTDNLPENDSLALAVSCRGKLSDFVVMTIPTEGKTLHYGKNQLTAGINQFTLYDSEGLIRSERLIFIEPTAAKNKKSFYETLTVRTNKETYNPYEHISLEVSTDDTLYIRTGNSVSIAVRDAATSNFGNSDNATILTNLLLSSDLKGYIKNPAWYFAENTEERSKGLDLLMLTQGWRRYNWSRMIGVEPFNPTHPIEEGIVIDGEIRSLLLKKPLEDVNLKLWMIRGTSSYQGDAVSDSAGRFSFFLDKLYDDWQLNIQTTVNEKIKNYRILLNRQFSPQPRWFSGYDTEIWTVKSQPAEKASDKPDDLENPEHVAVETAIENPEGLKEYKLKEIVVTAERHLSYKQEVARNASVSFDVEKKIDAFRDKAKSEASDVYEFLNDMSPYFYYSRDSDSVSNITYKGRPVRFLLYNNDTETEYGSTQVLKIAELTPEDIDRIIILEEHEAVRRIDPSDMTDPVLIFIYTKPLNNKTPIGVRRTTFTGYALERNFFSPTYSADDPVIDPDYRRTLYWNPYVSLDKNGKARVEFYNNSSCTKMQINAEGITSNGTLLLTP